MSDTHPYNLLHLVFADGPIAVYVVESERPFEFAKGLARRGKVQCHNVLLKIQGAVGIRVKAAEDVPGVSGGVGIWKETCIDALKLLLGDTSGGTLFEEGGVPCAELFLGVLGVQLQVIQDLFGQSAAFGVPHIPKLFTG